MLTLTLNVKRMPYLERELLRLKIENQMQKMLQPSFNCCIHDKQNHTLVVLVDLPKDETTLPILNAVLRIAIQDTLQTICKTTRVLDVEEKLNAFLNDALNACEQREQET